MRTIKAIQIIVVLTLFLCQSVTDVTAQKSGKNAMATLAKLSDEFEAVVQAVSPAIVQILATGYAPSINSATATVLSKQRSTGSGVILDPNGLIITNAHVVESAKRIQVALALSGKHEGESILKPRGKIVGAQLVGIDRETDLAVLKIFEKNLPYLTLGNSDSVRKGQIVLAFGSPLGLENSVTMGVVSSVARQLQAENPMIYIQTDAPINPGSSGGPLVNTDGEVVGINTLIFSQSGGNEGIGFAAPSNIVRTIYNQIRITGRVRRGVIGVHVQTITPLLAEGLELPNAGNVLVANVVPHSPADKAGLRVGDIILKLDGKPMENGRQFDINLYRKTIEDNVLLEIQRGEVNKVVKVAIMERPDDPQRFSDLVSPERNLIPKLDILVLDLDDTIRRMLPRLRIDSGVVVANQPNLFYEGEEFRPGDLIHAVNNESVTSIADLKAIVNGLRPFDAVVAQVERAGEFRYVAFEME